MLALLKFKDESPYFFKNFYLCVIKWHIVYDKNVIGHTFRLVWEKLLKRQLSYLSRDLHFFQGWWHLLAIPADLTPEVFGPVSACPAPSHLPLRGQERWSLG